MGTRGTENGRYVEGWGTGFSLVEVLVAAAVFSVGLAGLSLTLMASVQGTAEARNRGAAVMHAESLAELILMNPAALGHYLDPPAPVSDCFETSGCGDAQWAAGNLVRWQYELRQSLAAAEGLVCRDASPDDGDRFAPACDGAGPAVVKVFWEESALAGNPVGEPQRVVRAVAE